MVRILGIVLIALMLDGCGNAIGTSSSKPEQHKAEVMKVKVFVDGRITAYDKEVNLDDLDKQLSLLKESEDVVWYYREAGNQEPHPNAMQIMELIVKHGIPVTFSSKADFSDYIGPDGVSHPR
jgi:biopolymer transport protein ExbD